MSEHNEMKPSGDMAAAREIPQPGQDWRPDWRNICAKCMDGDIEPKFCAYYGEPNGCNSPIYGEHPTTEKTSAVGNMAAVRKALLYFVHDFASFRQDVEHGNLHMMQCMDFVKKFIPLMEAALAAPPRNCDRFADETDAQIEFLNEVWLISVTKETALERDRFENWTDEMKSAYAKWLLAPAKEQNGENDGSK